MMLTQSALTLCAMMTLTAAAGRTDVLKPSTSCPNERWTAVKDRCFFYVSRQLTWAQAEQNCQNLGGHLASAHSFLEMQVIERVIVTVSGFPGPAWIGGSDAQQRDYWFWSDGTYFNYKNWCVGKRTYYHERCMLINYPGFRCWGSVSCFHALPSVCAREVHKKA